MAVKNTLLRISMLVLVPLLLNACVFDDDDSNSAPAPSGGNLPDVSIISPATDTVVSDGKSLTFTATATDNEDGDVSASLNWSSSLDGSLGTGSSVDATLSVGVHTITASAQDSFVQSGSDSITVTVEANGGDLPVVSITSPTNEAAVDDETQLTFTATATDTEDDDVAASISWSSSLDGSLGAGSSIDTTLSVGVHTITASAQDSYAQVGSDSITVTVNFASGLKTLQSGGVEREYYLKLPSDYSADATAVAAAVGEDTRKPLVFAYHGYTGEYTNWVGQPPDYDPSTAYYDFVEVVGDDAIIVVPNGLPNASGQRVWGGKKDLDFFVDMLAELDQRGLQYNPNKILVVGHSNGAGFTHELGCHHGDVIRAIAVAAGALISNDCVGSIAVLMMQGSNDPLTNEGLALDSRTYWALYNGWNDGVFGPATVGPCDDYSAIDNPPDGNLPYPVLWCEHTQGHSWPDYGSNTVWNWFSGLPEVEPGPDAPPGGGAERATPPADANLTFQVQVPAEINRPLIGAATLRPVSYIDNPTCSAPDVILNPTFSLDGKLIPGELSDPITIPITYFKFGGGVPYPSDWAFTLTVYVEGGSTSVIPTPGVDYDVSVPFTLVDPKQDVVIDQVLTLEPVPDLCGFGA